MENLFPETLDIKWKTSFDKTALERANQWLKPYNHNWLSPSKKEINLIWMAHMPKLLVLS